MLAIGAVCFAGLGLAAAALIRSADAVAAVVNVIILPMSFLSGSFGTTDELPPSCGVADVLPLKYLLDLVEQIELNGRELWSQPGDVAVVAGWCVVGLRSPSGCSAGSRARATG